jgi:hypothetical protein
MVSKLKTSFGRIVSVDKPDDALEVLLRHVWGSDRRQMRLAGQYNVREIPQFAVHPDGLGKRAIELSIDREHRKRNFLQIKLRAGRNRAAPRSGLCCSRTGLPWETRSLLGFLPTHPVIHGVPDP